MNKAKVFAYYLPQYHPIKENDEWWGKGFTEWVSVARARPLFKGHYQPIIPEELGFYDLRLAESREQQARLAKEHGVSGFCYWHYWLGNGKRLLELPFNEVLKTGSPDFPFYLGWANHSWKGVFFGSKGKTLVEQKYNGKADQDLHFAFLLKAFNDKRYVRINDKPVLHIYNPKGIPDCKNYLKYWRECAVKAGFKGLHLIGENLEVEQIENYGVDAVTYSFHREIQNKNFKNKYLKYIARTFLRIPGKLKVFKYKDAMKYFLKNNPTPENEYPCIVPNWDTTARLGKDAVILHGSTPQLFKEHVIEVLESIKGKPNEEQILYLKSWNEWAEGNYMEPDIKHGRKYLEALRDALSEFNKSS